MLNNCFTLPLCETDTKQLMLYLPSLGIFLYIPIGIVSTQLGFSAQVQDESNSDNNNNTSELPKRTSCHPSKAHGTNKNVANEASSPNSSVQCRSNQQLKPLAKLSGPEPASMTTSQKKKGKGQTPTMVMDGTLPNSTSQSWDTDPTGQRDADSTRPKSPQPHADMALVIGSHGSGGRVTDGAYIEWCDDVQYKLRE